MLKEHRNVSFGSVNKQQKKNLTSVAIMHSFFSSAITKTDWYIKSLGEHIVDILHSGL